jgi:hypothetical protein
VKPVLSKGDVMEIKKVVTVKFEGMNVSLSIDSDIDGEAAVAMQIKLPEVFAELVALFTKPKSV